MVLRLVLAGLILALLSPLAGWAEETPLPLLEVGVLGGGGTFPDYPAADQNHFKGIVAPFLIYRGEVFQSDERGLRGRFYQSPRLDFDVSLDGGFPASSSDNRARDGMPDLDWMGQIGPSLRVNLDREPGVSRVDLELPLRAVFTTDFSSIDYRGLVLSPEIAWRRLDLLFPGSRLRFGLGPVFGSDGFMDYFYEVKPRYARQGRPAYDADAGYLGTRLQGSYNVPVTDRLSLVAGGRVDAFYGATNEGSPLFQRNLNFSLLAGFSYSFYQSDARTKVARDRLD